MNQHRPTCVVGLVINHIAVLHMMVLISILTLRFVRMAALLSCSSRLGYDCILIVLLG